uniref:Cytochrome P450 n=1 Tax=Panagrolaimus superbus TaxID=310955 RepID=A0A914YWK9_9BILA
MPVVCVNDSKTIYETFVKDGETYAGRAQLTEWLEVVKHGQNGIIFSEGEPWREHRRFALRVFRDFGFGKNLMQEKILDEFVYMMDSIKADKKAGIINHSLQDHIDLAVGSVINSLLFGFRCSSNKKEDFNAQKEIIGAAMKDSGRIEALIMQSGAHKFRFLPYFRKVYYDIQKNRDKTWAYFDEHVQKRKETMDLDSDADPVDYVEAFLRQQHQLNLKGEKHHFTDTQLYGILWDLWIAGQETTSHTTAWACQYLIKNLKCQAKVHEELSKFIGSDRLITITDKPNLHYINAVVAETQRCCNLVNTNVLHRTLKDVKIHGYDIPKHTVIISHITSVLYDERYFPDPYTFKPERFLDKNGIFSWPPELMPFGLGKRACLGESLARMELFLFIANLFNQFIFKENPEKPINEERHLCGTIAPQQYTCLVERRSYGY